MRQPYAYTANESQKGQYYGNDNLCHDQWTEAQAHQPKVSQYGSLNFQTFLRILFQRNSLFKQTFVDDVFFLPTNQFLEAV